MSIQQEVDRIGIAKNAIRNAIEAKGVSVPSTTSIDNYAEKIAEIPTGGGKYSLTWLGNYGPEWLRGTTYHDAGEVIILGNGSVTGGYYFTAVGDDSADYTFVEAAIAYTYTPDGLPTPVQEALVKIPSTFVGPPPISSEGYAWFIMPACDIVMEINA